MIETRVVDPLFRLSLFRIRAFTAGNIATFVVAVARGGLQFMLIIWLQGIWLPQHGYDYSQTPLWAGVFLLPLTVGFLVSGPLAGTLSDRFGTRGMATAGMVVFGASFIGLMTLPVDFSYWSFAVLIAANGIGSGMFAAPNTSAIMGSVPARYRGVASGMRSTFQNSGTALSIGAFFALMIAGLANSLSKGLTSGLQHHGVPQGVAHHIGSLPPVSSLFAAILGVNPIQHLLAPSGTLAQPSGFGPADPYRPRVLPESDIGAVPPRSCPRVRPLRWLGRLGCGGLAVPRRPLHRLKGRGRRVVLPRNPRLRTLPPCRPAAPRYRTQHPEPTTGLTTGPPSRKEFIAMADALSFIDPQHTALLVMDFQVHIVDAISDADVLLSRTADAIAVVRRHGGQIGYVRVAFEDSDFAAIPSTNKMFERVAAMGNTVHSQSPASAVHELVAPQEGDIVVRKTRVGAFSTTDLDGELRQAWYHQPDPERHKYQRGRALHRPRRR